MRNSKLFIKKIGSSLIDYMVLCSLLSIIAIAGFRSAGWATADNFCRTAGHLQDPYAANSTYIVQNWEARRGASGNQDGCESKDGHDGW